MNASHRVTLFFLLSSLLTLFYWNLQWDISEYFEDYGDKGNFLRQKQERGFLRNCFVIFEFNTQNYTAIFIEQFAYTVFLESAI